uniref:Uncharacterized protein n=1 Tax=Caenorhabditis japonica TaxID=281687 RepID=A0A8R1I1L3_CAEJA
MASTSIKSAVARIENINYANLEELKNVGIPKHEQEAVKDAISKKKKIEPLPSYLESRLKVFNKGAPMKCVRMPKREQRLVYMYIDDHPAEMETIGKAK